MLNILYEYWYIVFDYVDAECRLHYKKNRLYVTKQQGKLLRLYKSVSKQRKSSYRSFVGWRAVSQRVIDISVMGQDGLLWVLETLCEHPSRDGEPKIIGFGAVPLEK